MLHRTNDPLLCPVLAWERRLRDMGDGHPNPNTLSHLWWDVERGFKPITIDDITRGIRDAATAVQAATAISPSRVSAASFRPGGATALLCANVSKETIKLLGRWQSDAVDTYLRTQANLLTNRLSSTMLAHGDYSFKARHDEDTKAFVLRQLHILPNNLTLSNIRTYIKSILDEYEADLDPTVDPLDDPPF